MQERKGVTVYSRRELREDRAIKYHRSQKCIEKWYEQERIIGHRQDQSLRGRGVGQQMGLIVPRGKRQSHLQAPKGVKRGRVGSS